MVQLYTKKKKKKKKKIKGGINFVITEVLLLMMELTMVMLRMQNYIGF
jgi:hypothetical protein